jgi:7-cyano-7-deazaguanine synthase
MKADDTAIVILSGGQDSATCAAIAKNRHDTVYAITFNYGQRHVVEMLAAQRVAEILRLDGWEPIDLGAVLKSSSPLVSDNPVEKYGSINELPGGVEPTFIPGRNPLFLTIAANRAAHHGAATMYTGLCQEDFGGYYDCRQEFVDAMSIAIAQAFIGQDQWLKIEAPLMDLTKAETVKLAASILNPDLFASVLGATHTCYDGVAGGCGQCHACRLRDRGFCEAGIDDPLWQLRTE